MCSGTGEEKQQEEDEVVTPLKEPAAGLDGDKRYCTGENGECLFASRQRPLFLIILQSYCNWLVGVI